MRMPKLFAVIVILLVTMPAFGLIQRDYSQRDVTVGQEFSIEFEYSAGTPVNWYVLVPMGPGIEFVDVKDVAASEIKTIKAQTGIPQQGKVGGPRVRTFIFKATESTEGTEYAIRFIKIDFSNKIYDSKTVSYKITA